MLKPIFALRCRSCGSQTREYSVTRGVLEQDAEPKPRRARGRSISVELAHCKERTYRYTEHSQTSINQSIATDKESALSSKQRTQYIRLSIADAVKVHLKAIEKENKRRTATSRAEELKKQQDENQHVSREQWKRHESRATGNACAKSQERGRGF